MTDDEFKLMNALAMTLDFVFETQSLVGEEQEDIQCLIDDLEDGPDIEVDIPFVNEYFVNVKKATNVWHKMYKKHGEEYNKWSKAKSDSLGKHRQALLSGYGEEKDFYELALALGHKSVDTAIAQYGKEVVPDTAKN